MPIWRMDIFRAQRKGQVGMLDTSHVDLNVHFQCAALLTSLSSQVNQTQSTVMQPLCKVFCAVVEKEKWVGSVVEKKNLWSKEF